MTKTSKDNLMPLRDILYAFSLEERQLNADLLDEYVCRFKEYAVPLTDFAIELAIDRLHDSCVKPLEVIESSCKVSPAVSRAISRFHNRLHQLSQPGPNATERTVQLTTSLPINPFATLDRESFRSLARAMGVTPVFLSKLRDRLIEPATIPLAFICRLADLIHTSVDSLKTHFAASSQTGLQFYKSDHKPEAAIRQSFSDAVRTSGLTEDERRNLLNL